MCHQRDSRAPQVGSVLLEGCPRHLRAGRRGARSVHLDHMLPGMLRAWAEQHLRQRPVYHPERVLFVLRLHVRLGCDHDAVRDPIRAHVCAAVPV